MEILLVKKKKESVFETGSVGLVETQLISLRLIIDTTGK